MEKKRKKDQLGQRLRTISSDLKQYFEKRIELLMLNTGEYVSGWMAASLLRVSGALLVLLGVCFLLIALAIYLGNLLDSESLGYVLVSLPLLLIGALFFYLKPNSLLEQLEQQFEAEVLKGVEQTRQFEQKEIESLTEKGSATSEE